MSYKIRYKPAVKMEKKIGLVLRNHRVKFAVAAGSILLLIFVVYNCGDTLREFLIPGDTDVTEAAFSELGNNLRDGVSVKDALTVFCLEIIENANIPK